jgi:hypothetical protein
MVLKSYSWLIAAILSIKYESFREQRAITSYNPFKTCKNSKPPRRGEFEKIYLSSDFLWTQSHQNTDTYQLAIALSVDNSFSDQFNT